MHVRYCVALNRTTKYGGVMAAAEALNIQSEGPVPTGDPTAVPEATAVPQSASPRWPQLIPIAQLIAIVLGVFAIIWNQQQTTDSLRNELRAEIIRVETGLRAEFSDEIGDLETGLRGEISELRAEVTENGRRLARIEGFLGIGMPDEAPQ